MYSFTSRIRFSETGRDRKLTLESLLDYFQDCSTFQSEDLGIGIDFLKEKDQAWVVNYWQLVIEEYPSLGETVRICTLPYDFKGCLGYRNFYMENEQGKRIVSADSLWTLLNMKKMFPARPGADMVKLYGREERIPMEYEPRRIALTGEVRQGEAIPVRPYHLDCNGHVNNGQYVRMAAGVLSADSKVRQLRVEYRRQAVLGDVLLPYIYEAEERAAVSLCREEGRPCAVVEFKFVKTS
ncbi:MAG: acyl-[Lachnospiraceae bacterium]|nr:acyl-[acyl-carrier-protein] thioesterase [Lachnospiraceae bacterium]